VKKTSVETCFVFLYFFGVISLLVSLQTKTSADWGRLIAPQALFVPTCSVVMSVCAILDMAKTHWAGLVQVIV